jgi:hypothetical protein
VQESVKKQTKQKEKKRATHRQGENGNNTLSSQQRINWKAQMEKQNNICAQKKHNKINSSST